MRYIWICMLLGAEMFWLVSSIIDVKNTIKCVEEQKQYDSTADFVDCVITNLEGYTKAFIVLHLVVLFFVSFIAWMSFKIDSIK